MRIADLSIIHLTVYMTADLLNLANRIVVDANGYELFNCPLGGTTEASSIEIPGLVLTSATLLRDLTQHPNKCYEFTWLCFPKLVL